MSDGLGIELSWLISSAQSLPSRASKLIPRPLGSSLRSSTWLRSQPAFCWDCLTSQ